MPSDPNGWPDASKPGVPLNPERDGWHWVLQDTYGFPVRWDAAAEAWHTRTFILPHVFAELRDYLGPCLTPAALAAALVKAKREGMEEAAKIADAHAGRVTGGAVVIAAAIRAKAREPAP
jgi:hypothetical protein